MRRAGALAVVFLAMFAAVAGIAELAGAAALAPATVAEAGGLVILPPADLDTFTAAATALLTACGLALRSFD